MIARARSPAREGACAPQAGDRRSPREITPSDLKVLLRVSVALAKGQSILRRLDQGLACASAAA